MLRGKLPGVLIVTFAISKDGEASPAKLFLDLSEAWELHRIPWLAALASIHIGAARVDKTTVVALLQPTEL